MNTSRSLLILLWNCNGLTPHRNELDVILHDRRIDVALLTETHFTNRSHFYIPDYVTYRTDHPDCTAHGGTAVLVRRQLSQYALPALSSYSLQSTAVSILFFPFSISFAAVYCPPNQNLTEVQLTSLFHSLGPRFISGGDYNCKHPLWGCRLATPRGRTLHRVITSQNYSFISPDSPTYWPSHTNRLPDILDFFVTSGIRSVYSAAHVLHDLSSDHSPVLLTTSLVPIEIPRPPTLTPGPTNWESFRETLNSQIDLHISLKTPKEVDEATQNFTEAVQKAAWASSQVQNHLTTRHYNVPIHIRNLISAKRRARSKWQRSRYPSDRRHFEDLARELRNELSIFRAANYDTYVSSLSPKDQSLWTATKRLLSYHSIPSPLLRQDNSWARSDEEKAEVFHSHISSIFQPFPDTDPVHTSQVYEFLDSPLPLGLPPRSFTPSEVSFIISRLPNRKSPGYDLITAPILKHFPRRALVFLTYIFNSVLRTTHFPLIWKFAYIKMIPKPKKLPTESSSYRPISLLPLLSKVLEKLLLKRLSPLLESQNIIPTHQFGFRPNHSTLQQCLRIVDLISSSLEKKEYCGGVFLDVAQAFDRVWHPGLLFKLKKILPNTYYLILQSYLRDRYSVISQKDKISEYIPIKASVPQGSVLGPLLYLIYISDIPTYPTTHMATFADDICILTSHPDPLSVSESLQDHLDNLNSWCKRWRIRINQSKSVHLTFTLRRQSCPPIMFDNIPIPPANHVHYLGLYTDKRVTWNPHTRLKRLDLNRKYGLLRQLLNRNSKLSIENKLTIYKTILKPTWTYGIELWGSAKKGNIDRIQSFQSKVLRTILNAPWYVSNRKIHHDLNIPTVHETIQSRFKSFHSKLENHPNQLANALSLTTHPLNPPRRLKRRWPRDLLAE
ncbi:hypothetical protein AAG570_006836 [Ranatra chinensis]|uniref:Reverse transcriptase domain-containing protein n=1 Tax=Ranatra chinensis TaxID=642074 RepID=A0ABD0ZII7_9HEMI